MKVARKMLHPGLRASYWPLKLLGTVLSTTWGLRLGYRLGRLSASAKVTGMRNEQHLIPSRHNGPDIRVRVFRPTDHKGDLPVMLYLHGGGYAMGCPEWDVALIERFITARPCMVVAPDYRKSFDAPFPAAMDDAYDTLLWINDTTKFPRTMRDKFIVAGQSAGGGLALAVTLRARDTGDVNIALQIPLYPMIDDRQSTNSIKDNNAPAWTAKATALAWKLYLSNIQDRHGDIPIYAAPARTVDFSNLPATLSFVGDLDPLADETANFMRSLSETGTPVVFETFAGGFHSFETQCPKAEISQQASRLLLENFAKFVDDLFQR